MGEGHTTRLEYRLRCYILGGDYIYLIMHFFAVIRWGCGRNWGLLKKVRTFEIEASMRRGIASRRVSHFVGQWARLTRPSLMLSRASVHST